MNDLSKDAVNWLTVGEDGAGQRIDNFLLKVLRGVPKSHVYRILRNGEIRLNRRRAGPEVRLDVGDVLRIPPIRASAPAPAARCPGPGVTGAASPPVLYEDEVLLALNKPSGLAVHGGSGVSRGAIECLRLARPAAPFLELVHRLDRETSGVLLVAKGRSALVDLHAQLRAGDVDKRYLVLVRGRWRDALRRVKVPLESYVTGDGERRVRAASTGREARTTLRRLRAWNDREPAVALLEAELETGRTHQIRVHLAHLGHPLAGDPKYGDFAWNRELAKQGLRRMFLHAWQVRFRHPRTGEQVTVEAPLAPELQRFLDALDSRAALPVPGT
jgi:23S rRNA pseudouridine955/2504/2580 synthase